MKEGHSHRQFKEQFSPKVLASQRNNIIFLHLTGGSEWESEPSMFQPGKERGVDVGVLW
jgi:hypothetical protein